MLGVSTATYKDIIPMHGLSISVWEQTLKPVVHSESRETPLFTLDTMLNV